MSGKWLPAVRTASAVLFLFVAAAAGGLVWLMVSVGEFSSTLTCVTTNMADLDKSTDALEVEFDNKLNSGDTQKGIQYLDEALPWVGFFAAIPGGTSLLWLIMVILAVCQSARPDGATFCCTKLFIIISSICLLAAVCLYAVLAIAGLTTDQEPLLSYKAAFIETCDGYEDMLVNQTHHYRQLIDDYSSELETTPESRNYRRSQLMDQLQDAQTQLTLVEDTISTVSVTCVCLVNLFPNLQSLAWPAIGAAAIFSMTLICVQRLCCILGCCDSIDDTLYDDDDDLKSLNSDSNSGGKATRPYGTFSS